MSTSTTLTAEIEADVIAKARAADEARVAFHEAVKAASATGASLRVVAAAANCSAEQVRRIITGQAK